MTKPRQSTVARLATHDRWLHGVLAVTLFLNLADAVLTMYWLMSGAATEANPLMEQALAWGPIPFVLGKTSLVALGSWILWKRRRRPLAVVCIFIAFLAYYWLLIYHLRALDLQLFSWLAG